MPVVPGASPNAATLDDTTSMTLEVSMVPLI
jgi:hypothetical protein